MSRFLKILLIGFCLIGCFQSLFAQQKQLCIQNKKHEWQRRNINNGGKIKVILNNESSLKGKLHIVNDTTILVGIDTCYLSNIAIIKKDKIWKIVLESYLIVGGVLFISSGIAFIVVDPNSWSAIVGAVLIVFGTPPSAAGAIVSSFKSSYHSNKWNYKIVNKKMYNYQ